MKYDNQVKGAATTSFELQKNSKKKVFTASWRHCNSIIRPGGDIKVRNC